MSSSDIFYTQFAPTYAQYAAGRKAYLSAVNDFICRESGSPSCFADFGSGDGRRAKTIADIFGITDIVLIDNSDGMIALSKKIPNALVVKADIASKNFKIEKKYDLVMCLWNVLGHISTIEGRKTALKNMSSLLTDDSVLFIDVNNRYNISQYGKIAVLKNAVKDLFSSPDQVGNFTVSLKTESGIIQTRGHIFNPKEIEDLIQSAGLRIEKRRIINYKTGSVEKNLWNGQLVYKLRKK